ncbi:hypothetical protein FGO68_gene12308 [Halteria grandinella]|uniref:Uncharacterized protein n=1 Tax=Halteria grandinella TaxID=5974 RepID=A0A8J8NLJ2_HALGN|nr:hypothetical protein FGO68_gene12308 [Halteria grandinella]
MTFRLTFLIKNQGSSSRLLINQRIKVFKSVKQQRNSSQGLDVGLSLQKLSVLYLISGLRITDILCTHSTLRSIVILYFCHTQKKTTRNS